MSKRSERASTAQHFWQSVLEGAPDSALMAPEFEYEQHFGTTGGHYVGEEGLQRWAKAFYEVWENASMTQKGVSEAADRIVLDSRVFVRAGQTGIEVEIALTAVFEFVRDGRIRRMDSFNDRAEALKAVGLEE